MGKSRIIQRKQGAVSVLYLELLVNQKAMLDDYSKKFNTTKSDIVAQALNMWFATMRKSEVN